MVICSHCSSIVKKNIAYLNTNSNIKTYFCNKKCYKLYEKNKIKKENIVNEKY